MDKNTKGIRPSANSKTATFGFQPLRSGSQGLLERAGRMVSEPLANIATNKAKSIQTGIGSRVADAVKGSLGDQDALKRRGTAGVLRASAKWLRSKQGAESTALATGGLALGGALGTGYLLSKAKEKENGV